MSSSNQEWLTPRVPQTAWLKEAPFQQTTLRISLKSRNKGWRCRNGTRKNNQKFQLQWFKMPNHLKYPADRKEQTLHPVPILLGNKMKKITRVIVVRTKRLKKIKFRKWSKRQYRSWRTRVTVPSKLGTSSNDWWVKKRNVMSTMVLTWTLPMYCRILLRWVSRQKESTECTVTQWLTCKIFSTRSIQAFTKFIIYARRSNTKKTVSSNVPRSTLLMTTTPHRSIWCWLSVKMWLSLSRGIRNAWLQSTAKLAKEGRDWWYVATWSIVSSLKLLRMLFNSMAKWELVMAWA